MRGKFAICDEDHSLLNALVELIETPKKPVLEGTIANWIHEIVSVTKSCDYIKHSSTNLTPIQASLKEAEKVFIKIF